MRQTTTEPGPVYLGLDLGTTNVKALLVDSEGRICANGSAPVSRSCTSDGGVEQDIEEIYSATCAALRQTVEGVDPKSIRSLGISAQGGALQILDAEQNPVGSVISWLDGRGTDYDRRLLEQIGPDRLFEAAGRRRSCIAPGQILRLNDQNPGLLTDGHISAVGDFIVGRLCGTRAHDQTSLAICMLLSPKTGRPDPKFLDFLGITESQLPRMIPITEEAGGITAAAARETGLPEGLTVSAAVHDQYAAWLGTGAVDLGQVVAGTGTAWVLVAACEKTAPAATDDTFVCPHPLPGRGGQMLSMGNGGSSLEWALKITGTSRRADDPDDWLDQILAAAQPGANGLTFWPLLSPGGTIDESAFGQPGGHLSGLRLAHNRADILRSVVEGLAMEFARHVRMLQKAGISVNRLTLSGRAAESRITPQILANLLDTPVDCVTESSLSSFGASVIGRALVDHQHDLEAWSHRLAPKCRSVEPDANRPVYQRLLESYLAAF
jgi:sugar (pentulose or hexulose) kinase